MDAAQKNMGIKISANLRHSYCIGKQRFEKCSAKTNVKMNDNTVVQAAPYNPIMGISKIFPTTFKIPALKVMNGINFVAFL